MKKNIGIIAGIAYLIIAVSAFFLNLETLLFFLSIPWSVIITFFGFLLIHMFDSFKFSNLEILGVLLNASIFFKFILFTEN